MEHLQIWCFQTFYAQPSRAQEVKFDLKHEHQTLKVMLHAYILQKKGEDIVNLRV